MRDWCVFHVLPLPRVQFTKVRWITLMVKIQLRRQIWRTGVQAEMIGIKDRSFWNYSNRTT